MATAEEIAFLQWLGGGGGDAEAFQAEWDATGPSDVRGPSGVSNQLYRASKAAQDFNEQAIIDEAYRVRGTNADPFRFNPRNNPETAWFTDPEGNFGLGMRPEDLYYNDASQTMVEGIQGWDAQPGSRLTLGGIGAPPGGGTPATAAREGQNTFDLPPNYDPEGGTGQPNGGLDPNYLPGPNNQGNPNAIPWGTNENFGQGGGAVTGVGNQDWIAGITPEKTGYESSSNKDFYQRQLQEMRTAQTGSKLGALAAAMRRQQAAAQPAPAAADPWAGFDLPEVVEGTGQRTQLPPDIQLNQGFNWGEGTTNQQIMQDIRPRLSDTEQDYLNKNPKAFENAPSFLNQNEFFDFTNTSRPNDKGYSNTLNKLYQNVWTDANAGSQGPAVPVGYASPTNL